SPALCVRCRSYPASAAPSSRNQLQQLRRCNSCYRFLLPQPKAAEKSIGVITGTNAFGKFFQFLHVAAAQDHIVRMNPGHEIGDNLLNVFTPFLLPQSSQRTDADVLLICALPVREVR